MAIDNGLMISGIALTENIDYQRLISNISQKHEFGMNMLFKGFARVSYVTDVTQKTCTDNKTGSHAQVHTSFDNTTIFKERQLNPPRRVVIWSMAMAIPRADRQAGKWKFKGYPYVRKNAGFLY